MGNRIPRNCKKLEVEFLTNTLLNKKGDKVIARKTENGWIGEKGDKRFHLFLGHLRNPEFCKIMPL